VTPLHDVPTIREMEIMLEHIDRGVLFYYEYDLGHSNAVTNSKDGSSSNLDDQSSI